MPWPARIMVAIAVLGALAFLVQQVRDLRRRHRNLRHFERGEPLEKAPGDWD